MALKKHQQHGMTLLELTVVLLILSAMAGLVVPYVAGTGEQAMCQTTDATMQTVKDAIMGGKAGSGLYSDMLAQLPKATRSTTDDYALQYLFTLPTDNSWGNLRSYNPKSGIGWRGPYLQTGNALPPGLDGSFAATSGASRKVHVAISGPQVLDGWGRPLILQVPNEASCDKLTGLNGSKPGMCARLLSAGRGNGLHSDDAAIDTPIDDDPTTTDAGQIEDVRQGDDRILYLRMPTPNNDLVSRPCEQN